MNIMLEFIKICEYNNFITSMQHPYLHTIERVEYLASHELLVIVQPLMPLGSLKDMIYKVKLN